MNSALPGGQSEEGAEGVDEDCAADVEDAEDGVADMGVHNEQGRLNQGQHQQLEWVVLAWNWEENCVFLSSRIACNASQFFFQH